MLSFYAWRGSPEVSVLRIVVLRERRATAGSVQVLLNSAVCFVAVWWSGGLLSLYYTFVLCVVQLIAAALRTISSSWFGLSKVSDAHMVLLSKCNNLAFAAFTAHIPEEEIDQNELCFASVNQF
jgi:hypothetical protein